MNRLGWWIASGFIGVTGFFCGYFGRQVLSIDLKKELGLGDVLQFGSTVCIALLLGNYLQQKYGNKRVEKDMIIEQIREAKSLAKDLRELFLDCFNEKLVSSDNFKAINGTFRNLSRSIMLIERALEQCKPNLGQVKATEFKYEFIEYKHSATSGAFAPVQKYSGEQFNDQETAYSDLQTKLQSLIFTINQK